MALPIFDLRRHKRCGANRGRATGAGYEMSDDNHRKRGWRRPGFIAALLAGTILAGGRAAWSAVASAAPPLSSPPVVNQAGFADLVAKVKPAIVNISILEKVEEIKGQQLQSLLPPSTPFSGMLRNCLQQQQTVPVHGLASGFIIDPAGYVATIIT